jgi:hypothetical protein
MPIISEASWSTEGKWLEVKRIEFISQVGDKTEATLPYTSSNPLSFDTTVDPGTGLMRWNNVDPTLVTQLSISSTDNVAGDQTTAIEALKIGDKIVVRQDATRYFLVDVAAEAIANAGWFQVDVDFVFAVGLIQNNKSLELQFTYFPESIPSGGDKLEVKMAQEWPWIVYRLFDPLSIVPKARGLIPISDVSLIEME